MADLLALQPNRDIKLHIVAALANATECFLKSADRFSPCWKRATTTA